MGTMMERLALHPGEQIIYATAGSSFDRR